MKLKDLKKGEFFTLKQIDYPTSNQVYVKGEYNRSLKKYCCEKFSDISYSRYIDGNKEVFTEFIF